MKKQIVVIHGGEAFSTYEEYLTFLRNEEVTLEDLSRKGWKSTLSERLGEGYDILAPRMPNALNAKYLEWKIYFEKFFPFIRDGVILVGHSLGGSFLAKFLAEEMFPKKIQAMFLIAAPYDLDSERSLVEFVPPASLKLLEEQGGQLFLYHSEDDPVVAFAECEKYRRALPTAQVRTFTDRGHFLQEEFPELIADIVRSVASFARG